MQDFQNFNLEYLEETFSFHIEYLEMFTLRQQFNQYKRNEKGIL